MYQITNRLRIADSVNRALGVQNWIRTVETVAEGASRKTQICTLRDISANLAVPSGHPLRSLKTLAPKNYCVLSGFLFFDPTGA
jgi:hypothetical protein